MLRFGFLPSDFHPQFLILGERPELTTLVETLRAFAKAPTDYDIAQRPPNEPDRRAALTLRPNVATHGLFPSDDPSAFEWRLNSIGADAFADLIARMIADPAPAASVMLEAGAVGEIPVKVSRGEFTDQFLIDDF